MRGLRQAAAVVAIALLWAAAVAAAAPGGNGKGHAYGLHKSDANPTSAPAATTTTSNGHAGAHGNTSAPAAVAPAQVSTAAPIQVTSDSATHGNGHAYGHFKHTGTASVSGHAGAHGNGNSSSAPGHTPAQPPASAPPAPPASASSATQPVSHTGHVARAQQSRSRGSHAHRARAHRGAERSHAIAGRHVRRRIAPLRSAAATFPTSAGPPLTATSPLGGTAHAPPVVIRNHVAGTRQSTHPAGVVKQSSASSSDPIKVLSRLVHRIPPWLWILLAAALLIAAIGGAGALLAARRARRQGLALAAMREAALTDPLTGVLNRRGFIEAAERELARAERYGRPFALAYVDIRGLKAVNDSHGHRAGDELLRHAAQLLTQSARADDVVGRLGGDELALLLAEQTSEGAAALAERIHWQLPAHRGEVGLDTPWDLTIGTAAFPDDGDELDELLRTADRRLYEQRGVALR